LLACGLDESETVLLFKKLRHHARGIYDPDAEESQHPKKSFSMIKATLRGCPGSPMVVQWPQRFVASSIANRSVWRFCMGGWGTEPSFAVASGVGRLRTF
jgi:hypothetical protein